MSTQAVSPDELETTRKVSARVRADVGQALAAVTQARAADLMGTSASTVSRMVADDLDRLCLLLAAIGLQVAPLDAMVMSKEEIQAAELFAYKYFQQRVETNWRSV
nr:CII family transcriptional regulator [uncultured Pseudomonas sp.]